METISVLSEKVENTFLYKKILYMKTLYISKQKEIWSKRNILYNNNFYI